MSIYSTDSFGTDMQKETGERKLQPKFGIDVVRHQFLVGRMAEKEKM